MRTVSNHKNFALRAPKPHDDEVGALIDGFNTMLSEIQERDSALQAVNENLQARTGQLGAGESPSVSGPRRSSSP